MVEAKDRGRYSSVLFPNSGNLFMTFPSRALNDLDHDAGKD